MTDAVTGTRRRENTRARLLDAAFDVFAEVGLDAASVEAVCDRAGFTRGAFYSNFASKDELFLELARTVSERKLEAITERVREITAESGEREGPEVIVQQLVEVSLDSRQGVLLMSEIRTRAMRDEQTAVSYRAWMDGMVARVTAIIEDLVSTYGMTLRMPAGEFAQIMLDLWESTAVSALTDRLSDEETARLMGRRTHVLADAVVEGFPAE
ncbi:helix-turn-helix domain containing protein [Microbacterium horticulturae]|uniref:Helix-turn-helix domain containing protein n=1 Tax=Microbacterium horticulturae TaxID=3028316 RepID=A0ABY8BZL0_9MICO|nr:TetR/AcrR family transcriptional regulator [Microbacterium sp. KACC 23027]WEG09640.1 helix-turn-helix domain containing protein [Microbacterium sp. KACC 23027]